MINQLILITEFNKYFPVKEKNNKLIIYRILPPRVSSSYYQFKIFRVFMGVITYLWLPIVIFTIFCKYRFKIVHLHGSIVKWLLILQIKLIGLKVIIDQKDLFLQYKSFMFADKIICSTKHITHLVSKYVQSNKIIEIAIPQKNINPPDTEKAINYLNSLNIKKPFILYVGTITPMKGVPELLEAFHEFKHTFPKYKLVLVGQSLMRKEIASDIFYLGTKSHEEVLMLMSQTDLHVLPSKSEGLPHVCFEAFYLRKKSLLPPIVSEYQEFCPDFVIPEITSEAICQKMIEVLSNSRFPEYPLQLHNPENIAKKTLKLYLELSS
ncbi:glycosyltransferase family 4 protein [Candidatus Margulisiibacteriota bacterium]